MRSFRFKLQSKHNVSRLSVYCVRVLHFSLVAFLVSGQNTMTMFTLDAYVIRYSLFLVFNFRVPLPTMTQHVASANDEYTLNSRFQLYN